MAEQSCDNCGGRYGLWCNPLKKIVFVFKLSGKDCDVWEPEIKNKGE